MDTPQPTPPAYDLSSRAMGIALGALLALVLILAIARPFPRVFAGHGEDRKSLMPTDPVLLDLAIKGNAGDVNAMNTLAACYMEGRGVVSDDVIGVMWLNKAADAGSGAAMNALGLFSFNGQHGIPRSDADGFDWFSKGAQHGDPQAMLNTGLCYATGHGVSASRQMAMDWLQKAARSEDANVRRQAIDNMRKLGAAQ